MGEFVSQPNSSWV